MDNQDLNRNFKYDQGHASKSNFKNNSSTNFPGVSNTVPGLEMNQWNDDIHNISGNRNIHHTNRVLSNNHLDHDIDYYGDYQNNPNFNPHHYGKMHQGQSNDYEEEDYPGMNDIQGDMYYSNNYNNSNYRPGGSSSISPSVPYHSNMQQQQRHLRNNDMMDHMRPMNPNDNRNFYPSANIPTQNRPRTMMNQYNNQFSKQNVNQASQQRSANNSYAYQQTSGGSNAQGRAINKMLLEILRERVIDPQRLDLAIESYCERMDCVNLATVLFHTGKKRMILMSSYISRIAKRFMSLKEELRSREASNALYGLKVMSSDISEVRELVLSIANKIASSTSEFVAQAVGNALYGLQMMTSDYEEVRFLLKVLANKVSNCMEPLEAQNVGNALYGLRGMNSDYPEVRDMITALTPKIATAREDLNGQALGNSLYGLQSMSSHESEVRFLMTVLATKVTHTWEDLKAQEIGNALYGLKRMTSDIPEVRILLASLIPKIAASPDILDSQAIGNSFYGLQSMKSDNSEVLSLLIVLTSKVEASCLELDGQAIGNSLFGLQGMNSDCSEVRSVINVLTNKISSSCLDMIGQEIGNCLFGLQSMISEYPDVLRLISALTQKIALCKQELSSQEIGNAMFGLQGIASNTIESRMLIRQVSMKLQQSHLILDPTSISMCLYGLQRMTSESQDVRLLLLTLSNKIEHSWKGFAPQHLTNCFFGLQNLSSHEQEVKLIIKSLIPKVQSCKDVMTAKQIGYLFYGLHNMNSDHDVVNNLIIVLTEKISLSIEPWTLQILSMVLYGMQGFSSENDAVALLLQWITKKVVDLVPEKVISDVGLLANSFFGLQRMNTSNPDVCTIMNTLVSKLLSVSPKKLINSKVCANIIYGLQNSNCDKVFVKSALNVLSNAMEEISKNFMGISKVSKKYMNLDGYNSVDTSYADALNDILSLYQASALSLFTLHDLDTDANLQARLYEQLSTLKNIVDLHSNEISLPCPLNNTEHRMAKQLSDLLAKESLVVKSGVIVHGFVMNAYISTYRSGLFNETSTSSYELNIEVEGSSYSYPSKELFYKLRKQYLEKEYGLKVESVPAEAFRSEGQNGFKRHSQVLSSLYRFNAENQDKLAIGELNHTSDGKLFFNNNSSLSWEQPSNTDFFSPNYNSVYSSQLQDSADDNLKHPTVVNNNSYQNTDSIKMKYVNMIPHGMSLSWVGDNPIVDQPLSVLFYTENEQSLPKGMFIGHNNVNMKSFASDSDLILENSPVVINRMMIQSGSNDNTSRVYSVNNDTRMIPPNLNSLGGSSLDPSLGSRMNPIGRISDSIEIINAAEQQIIKNNRADKPLQPPTFAPIPNTVTLTPNRFSENDLDSTIDTKNYNQTEFTPVSSSQNSLDNNENVVSADIDDEIAALEAQLEVARLEAKLKLLKAKKKQK